MYKILEFFAKKNKTTTHVVVKTNFFNEYQVQIFQDEKLKELKTTQSVSVATMMYQAELSRCFENKMQIIFL